MLVFVPCGDAAGSLMLDWRFFPLHRNPKQ